MKQKYILSGGNTGRFQFTPDFRQAVNGFENNCLMFDPERWHGEYIDRESIFANPSLLDGCNLWILVTEWGYKDRPEVATAIRYAKNKGTIVGCEQNGPYYAAMICTRPAEIALRRQFDFIQNPSNDSDVSYAVREIYDLPYFSAPTPIIPKHFSDDYDKAKPFNLPYEPGKYFVFGHAVTDINYCTLQVAELFGIPLIVNVWDRGSGYGAWIKAVEEDGGFKHVKFTPHLDHEQWLYQMKMSRGLFYLTFHPSGGRPMLYAAMAGKISLSIRSGWQSLLFPEITLRPDFTAGVGWQKTAEHAEYLLPLVKKRIEVFSPEQCRKRFEVFLKDNGWA